MVDTNNVEFVNPDAESVELISRETVATSLGLSENASWTEISAKVNELAKKDMSKVPTSVDEAKNQQIFSN